MTDLLKSLQRNVYFLRYRFRYLINFILIGFLSIVLEIFLISQLRALGADSFFALGIGFVSGMFFSYILNANLNFKIPRSQNARTFTYFVIISTASFFLNIILMRGLSNLFDTNYAELRFVTAGCIFMISYLAHRKITFRSTKKIGVAVYLSANQSISEIYAKVKHFSDFVHLDLVDDTMSENAQDVDLSLIKEVDQTWRLKKMIHIMSKKPIRWIRKIHNRVDVILVHPEIDENIEEVISLCKSLNKKIGIVLSKNTSVSSVSEILKRVDYVQVMGIDELGKSGQSFNPVALKKINELNELRRKREFRIIFDGGVKPTNIPRIDAEYIVAASGLLSSDDPIKSFLELKTSARYRDTREELRRDIINSIRSVANSIDFVESLSLVGSFAESKSLEGISDIDIIVLVDKLNEKKFNSVVEKFKEKVKNLESNYGYPIYLNTSFGPLKFPDFPIVFHLMIYDRELHKKHCIKSPFTCFDWQRSRIFVKKDMGQIYKVRMLQPSNFFHARRSANEYLEELAKNRISYREYRFNSPELVEDIKFREMSSRDRLEFANHITKFVMTNFLKLYAKKNIKLSRDEMIRRYFFIFPKNKERHLKFLKEISLAKKKAVPREPENTANKLELFIQDFESQFRVTFDRKAVRLVGIRHFNTKQNEKPIFLGQRIDPRIISPNKSDILETRKALSDVKAVYSSPSLRCKETLKVCGTDNFIVTDKLKEIDYGLVEGKDASFLERNYPAVLLQWELGEDPKFPGGENYQDLLERIFGFLDESRKHAGEKIAFCTHNVVLRAMIGMSLKVRRKEWHKINVPHGKPLNFVLTPNKSIYLDCDEETLLQVMKNFPNG